MTEKNQMTEETTLTKAQFCSELEQLINVPSGSLRGEELLSNFPGWDSITHLQFIAMAQAKLGEVPSPAALAGCRSVADLIGLFPGKIA